MKKEIIITILTLCLVISTSTINAKESEQQLDPVLKERIYNRIEENEIPKIEAWETDLNGNITQVAPISLYTNQSRTPNDGAVYVFQAYSPNYVKKNMTYKIAGTYTVTNNTSSKIKSTYEQQSTVTHNAEVSANINGKAEIRSAFLAKLEIEAGISGTYKKTWSKGEKYGIQQTIPPHSTRVLTNYVVGVNSNGALNYKKYVGGTFAGYYTETAGGTIISKSDVHIVIDD